MLYKLREPLQIVQVFVNAVKWKTLFSLLVTSTPMLIIKEARSSLQSEMLNHLKGSGQQLPSIVEH